VGLRKKKATEKTNPLPVVVKRAHKPERCAGHKFMVEAEGRVDTLASYEVTDDSICFNCGLYFSTWVWYSEKITTSYRNGIDNEAGQAINFIAKQLDTATDKPSLELIDGLLTKLRERRQANGKRI
jgi:hypothetical protein